MSSTRASISWPVSWMVAKRPRDCSSRLVRKPSWAMPSITWRGVRSSWLMLARKSLFAEASRSASAKAAAWASSRRLR